MAQYILELVHRIQFVSLWVLNATVKDRLCLLQLEVDRSVVAVRLGRTLGEASNACHIRRTAGSWYRRRVGFDMRDRILLVALY